jgi:hypothetical protein
VLVKPDVFYALKILEIIGFGEHGFAYRANISTIFEILNTIKRVFR